MSFGQFPFPTGYYHPKEYSRVSEMSSLSRQVGQDILVWLASSSKQALLDRAVRIHDVPTEPSLSFPISLGIFCRDRAVALALDGNRIFNMGLYGEVYFVFEGTIRLALRTASLSEEPLRHVSEIYP